MLTDNEPRVTCPVCKGAATCMLCDDNGQVPLSSVTGDRIAHPRPKLAPPRVPGGKC